MCPQVLLLRQGRPSGRLAVLLQALTSPRLATAADAATTLPPPVQVPRNPFCCPTLQLLTTGLEDLAIKHTAR
jgi:hypothetical protein